MNVDRVRGTEEIVSVRKDMEICNNVNANVKVSGSAKAKAKDKDKKKEDEDEDEEEEEDGIGITIPVVIATPLTPKQALEALVEGNKRYREGTAEMRDFSPKCERFASGQAPFTAILSCADSRVSPTLTFDVDRGNIFQVRVAGNVVDTQVLGSLEYAVAILRVPLVVVMAHTDCGAVTSAVQAFVVDAQEPKRAFPPKRYGVISEVCRAIYPAVAALPAGQRTVPAATRQNVAMQVKTLLQAAPVLSRAVREGRLVIVGAEYMISSDPKIDGFVDFFLSDAQGLAP